MFDGEAAAWADLRFVVWWQADRDARRDRSPLAAPDDHRVVEARVQVESRRLVRLELRQFRSLAE